MLRYMCILRDGSYVRYGVKLPSGNGDCYGTWVASSVFICCLHANAPSDVLTKHFWMILCKHFCLCVLIFSISLCCIYMHESC